MYVCTYIVQVHTTYNVHVHVQLGFALILYDWTYQYITHTSHKFTNITIVMNVRVRTS